MLESNVEQVSNEYNIDKLKDLIEDCLIPFEVEIKKEEILEEGLENAKKTIRKVQDLQKELPKQIEECVLSNLLDFVLFIYFFVLSVYLLKKVPLSHTEKIELVETFLDEVKPKVENLKIKLERFIALNFPRRYEMLAKYDEYMVFIDLFTLTIAFVSVCEEVKKSVGVVNEPVEKTKNEKAKKSKRVVKKEEVVGEDKSNEIEFVQPVEPAEKFSDYNSWD